MKGLHILAFKVDFNDVVRRNTGIEQVLLEQVEEEVAFPATPYSCKNLDEIIVFCGDKLSQKVLASNLHRFDSCLFYLKLFKKYKQLKLYHNLWLTATAVIESFGAYSRRINSVIDAGLGDLEVAEQNLEAA